MICRYTSYLFVGLALFRWCRRHVNHCWCRTYFTAVLICSYFTVCRGIRPGLMNRIKAICIFFGLMMILGETHQSGRAQIFFAVLINHKPPCIKAILITHNKQMHKLTKRLVYVVWILVKSFSFLFFRSYLNW